MKILLLPVYFYPEHVASSYLVENRNQAFIDAGFNIEIHTPTPCRGISEDVRQKYCRKKYRHEVLHNGKMAVYRFSMFPEGKNPFMRAMRYSICWIKQLCRTSKVNDLDCIFTSSTPPIQGLIGALMKKKRHIPFVYCLQDIFPDSLVGTGLAKKDGVLWKIGREIEDFTYKHADKIIVISEDFKRNIMAKGVPENKIEVVYNWVDETKVIPINKNDNPLFEEFGISRDKFNVVYAGNLGNAQNIDVIIDSAKALSSDDNIEFFVFGTGGIKEKFVQKVKDYGIQNVKFFPLQPIERVSQVYGLGDACVVSCKPGLGGAAMPSKMVSIMSAGRAVAASFDEGELTHILKTHNCGLYAPAGDVQAFVNMIRSMASNPEKCNEMGRNARQLILEQFTREVGTRKYVEIIKSVAGKL